MPMTGGVVDEQTFVETSRETWDRLGDSVEDARRVGVTRMGSSAIKQLYEDYRHTAADLAYAQTHFPSTRIEAHLNQLVGQAHAELYGSSPSRWRGALHFLGVGYPRLIRRYGRLVLFAGLLLFGGMALGYLLTYINYPLARLFIPEALRDGVGDTIEQGAETRGMMAAIAPLLSAGITANNIQVALLAFAGGMTFGVLTVYAMVYNGLAVGALAGVFAKGGESVYFWSLIVPHGALELPAIVLAGASGLLLARALISPGDVPRITALTRVGPDAVKLVLGTVPLFILAGIIEAFLTPSEVAPEVKLLFGALLTLALLAYVLLPGRRADRAEREGRGAQAEGDAA
jgi:uncharacterized membrane protein SpoIIM required for sporulation